MVFEQILPKPLYDSLVFGVLFQAVMFFSKRLTPILFPQFIKGLKEGKGSGNRAVLWDSTVTSLVHGCIVGTLGLQLAITTDALSNTNNFSYTNDQCNLLGRIMLGYFMCDLMTCVKNWDEWAGVSTFIIHHVSALSSINHILDHNYAHHLLIVLAIMELTTPFVSLRWFMDALKIRETHGKSGRLIHLVNGFFMWSLWIALRLVYFGYMGYVYLVQNKEGLLQLPEGYQYNIIIGFTLGYLLQLLWGLKITEGFFKAVKGFNRKEAVKVE